MKYPWLMVIGLAACSGGAPPLPPPSYQTIIPAEYLVQSRACDGDIENPLHASDPITCRRFDFGRHQASDNFLLTDGSVITTWSYPPFGPFTPPADGGEHYVTEGPMTRIDSTEDGGTPFVVQYFVGAQCGGTGWLSFRHDVAPQPTQAVARLAISKGNPHQCSTGSSALTVWWTADLDYPHLGVIPSVISEHFDRGDINSATALEKFYFGKGWGRLVWQAFVKGSLPPGIPVPDLPQRCPDFGPGMNTPPGPGWTLVDCRESVNIEKADGSLRGAYLWHPR